MVATSKTEQENKRSPLAFTRDLLIVASPNGIAVHTHPMAPQVELGLGELEFLCALDSPEGGILREGIAKCIGLAAHDYGVEPKALWSLVKQLRVMKVLRPVAKISQPIGGTTAALPSKGESPPPLDLDLPLRLHNPLVMRIHGGRYEHIGHDGRVAIALSPLEMFALGTLTLPTRRGDALEAHREGAGDHALSPQDFDDLLNRLHRARLVSTSRRPETKDTTAGSLASRTSVEEHFRDHAHAQDAAEREHDARTGRTRTRVIPVAFNDGPPLGLGMIMAYAQTHDGGRLNDHYSFRHDWVWAEDRFDVFTERPAIYLFSNYLWSHAQCAELSSKVKAKNPASVTIHGGPDTPRYPRDVERYFADNPHVDIAVHGEGELAAAEILSRLTDAWDGETSVDLSTLSDITGISYRVGDSVVHTKPRARITDVNIVPSPILNGMFDSYRGVPQLRVTIETNRGCPYGCTFCDWGAATMTKIRQFDLQRTLDELRWISSIGAFAVTFSDANFGIFPRDVEIAEEAARLCVETGSPRAFGASYAKNSVKHLKHIIETLAGAGMVAAGVLAFQTSDAETLKAVKRSNIKKEKYDQLAVEMREARLPLVVELMLGLPGATVESFKSDLQECIERELTARINITTVLINSPMNAPEYRAEHQLETDMPHAPGRMPMLVSASSFTREEHLRMLELRALFMFVEHFGCLRLISRFVRQESGVREIDLLHRLMTEIPSRDEYPLLGVAVSTGWGLMAPPLSWSLVLEELRHYLVKELGIADDSALNAALEAQRALLPSPDRLLPETRSLEHDVVAWHAAMMRAKRSETGLEWTESTPRLSEFGPGDLVIKDPAGFVQRSLGVPLQASAVGAHWEFDTPLARQILPEGVPQDLDYNSAF